MVEIARILSPTDFSEFSKHALEHALAVARWHGARVTVLHIQPPPVPVSETPFAGYAAVPLPPPPDAEQLTREVRRFCEPVTAGGQLPEIVIRDGNPVNEIVEQAEQMPADLLVLGTHGRGGFERVALGSVTERVIRKVRCPVLTVPPRSSEPSAGPVPFKTILCAIDFSPSSIRALEFSLAWAKEADARLILLHVLDSHVEETHVGEMAHFTVPEYFRYREDDARTRLNSMLPDEARTWCSPEHRLSSGKPYQEILGVAAEAGAGLIVMGVRGRGAASLLVLGSTTNHVVRSATCPVLTVKS